MAMGRDWDVRRRAGTGIVGIVHGTVEGARGLTVTASAVQGTRESGGRALDEAAGYGVSSPPESSTICIGGEVLVSELH